MEIDRRELSGTFPERLYQARRALGWSQSELARRVWGETTDTRGYTVARNRDRVSAYEAGKAEPTRENLEELARAMGLEPGDLAPEGTLGVGPSVSLQRALAAMAARQGVALGVSGAGAGGDPEVSFRRLPDDPGRAHLRVNMVVAIGVAQQVLALLAGEGITA